jgi:hypothetical protein
VWGRAGEAVELIASLGTVGERPLAESGMALTTPDGKNQRLDPARQNDHVVYSFTPPVTGTYRLQWRSGANATIQPIRCSVPWAFLQPASGLHLFRCVGQLYFTVPIGVERFALQVSGEGTAETVKAMLRNSAGQVVGQQDNVALPYVFVPERHKNSATEIWSLTLEKASAGVLEDVTIQTLGIPPIFAAW